MAIPKSEFVVDVGEGSFEAEVLERSKTVPVLVDFWAPWCTPCKTFGPILEKLAIEYGGRFILAKLNTDENPSISMEYRIQGIPNVMMFRDGGVVDQFVGAYPESSIRKFLDPYCPSEANKLFGLAERCIEDGKSAEAELLLKEVVKLDPTHSAAHLALARILISSGRGEQAISHLDAISGMADEYESATRLREVLLFQDECQQVGGEQVWRRKVEGDPNDLDARFGLASCLAAAGKFREALDEFLAIVIKNKRFRDEAPRKAMLAIFSVIGERSELADEYRTRLSRTLY